VLTPPQHVPGDVDPCEGRPAERIGEVRNDKLESIALDIDEVAREEEGFDRAVGIPAGPDFRRDAHPASEKRALELFDRHRRMRTVPEAAGVVLGIPCRDLSIFAMAFEQTAGLASRQESTKGSTPRRDYLGSGG
jgi:hypothetical protein